MNYTTIYQKVCKTLNLYYNLIINIVEIEMNNINETSCYPDCIHHNVEEDTDDDYGLFYERVEFLEGAAEQYDIHNVLKDPINSLNEAIDRGVYKTDPHFPGEE
jgi:hypothetical protein